MACWIGRTCYLLKKRFPIPVIQYLCDHYNAVIPCDAKPNCMHVDYEVCQSESMIVFSITSVQCSNILQFAGVDPISFLTYRPSTPTKYYQNGTVPLCFVGEAFHFHSKMSGISATRSIICLMVPETTRSVIHSERQMSMLGIMKILVTSIRDCKTSLQSEMILSAANKCVNVPPPPSHFPQLSFGKCPILNSLYGVK